MPYIDQDRWNWLTYLILNHAVGPVPAAHAAATCGSLFAGCLERCEPPLVLVSAKLCVSEPLQVYTTVLIWQLLGCASLFFSRWVVLWLETLSRRFRDQHRGDDWY